MTDGGTLLLSYRVMKTRSYVIGRCRICQTMGHIISNPGYGTFFSLLGFSIVYRMAISNLLLFINTTGLQLQGRILNGSKCTGCLGDFDVLILLFPKSSDERRLRESKLIHRSENLLLSRDSRAVFSEQTELQCTSSSPPDSFCPSR
ncbi:hypothetical protein B0H19DRAFT_1267848 [Mycena capillaripes]|nr:hypothetical protein B0H19DRAFT_1267848 [Mycena capillaripes]